MTPASRWYVVPSWVALVVVCGLGAWFLLDEGVALAMPAWARWALTVGLVLAVLLLVAGDAGDRRYWKSQNRT